MNINELVLGREIKYFKTMQIVLLQGHLLQTEMASDILFPTAYF